MLSAFSRLQYLACVGAGRLYTAPGSPVIAVAYNGVLLRQSSLLYGYNVTGSMITLNFPTELGDSIYAICVA